MSFLEVKNLVKHYKVGQNTVKALDGVSFNLEKKKTLGIVGESGCGKSTLARNLMMIEKPDQGEVLIEGRDLLSMDQKEKNQTVQMIFQDPYNSLNPRKKAWQIIADPLLINSNLSKDECYKRSLEMMEFVGLRPDQADRFPHMFSGGQRQRLGIARAIIMKPKLIVCDEAVSALDVSVQAQVLNLLVDLQNEFDLTYLFISHDLSVVKHISDDIMVMYLGRPVELGTYETIDKNPFHPYTKALLGSEPGEPKPYAIEISGELPSPLNPPQGCHFHGRCPFVKDECKVTYPSFINHEGRFTACHLTRE